MNNTGFKGQLQASFPNYRRLIASSLVIGLLGTLDINMVARASTASEVQQSQNALQLDPVTQRLLGSWQGQSSFFQPITYIFTPEGKLFLLLSDSAGVPVAVEYQYRINPTSKPQQLDVDIITSSDSRASMTIFAFTTDGKLRLEATNFGNSRPTAFTTKAVLLQKISATTSLPSNTILVDFEFEANRARELQARNYIGSLNRAQQAYYLENSIFATTIEQLGVGLNPETESYRYQILPQGDQTQSVLMTATAKRPGIKSYTGAVFAVKSSVPNENLTIGGICETDQPSPTPPDMPTLTGGSTPKIQCPAGSHSLGG